MHDQNETLTLIYIPRRKRIGAAEQSFDNNKTVLESPPGGADSALQRHHHHMPRLVLSSNPPGWVRLVQSRPRRCSAWTAPFKPGPANKRTEPNTQNNIRSFHQNTNRQFSARKVFFLVCVSCVCAVSVSVFSLCCSSRVLPTDYLFGKKKIGPWSSSSSFPFFVFVCSVRRI